MKTPLALILLLPNSKAIYRAEGKYYMTANCPAIVKLNEKYHPELVPNLARVSLP
jgi:iron only hydrogenase large subunit-like protein